MGALKRVAIVGIVGAVGLASISVYAPAAAQVDLEQLHLSSDTNVRVPEPGTSSTVIANDRSEIILQADGTGSAQVSTLVSPLAGVDVDAFDRSLRRKSIDTARTIAGVPVRPGDVFFVSGGSSVVIDFDAAAAGVPDGVNLDAVTRDAGTGALLVSFDRFFQHPAVTFVLPGDLVAIAGGQLDSIALNGSMFPDGVNLDGAHHLEGNLFLVSVDIDTQLPGGSGAITVSDDDVILYDRSTGDFDVLLGLAEESHPSWQSADLDALWAERAAQGGEIRILDSFREVQESVGTVTLRVERINGSEGPAGIFLDAVGGSATEGVDFSGDVVYDGLWADGESGVRTVNAVDIVDDGSGEPIERFTVELSIFSGDATVGTPSVATVRILDNDGDTLFQDGFES